MTTDRIAALEAALEWIDKHDDAGDALYRAPGPFAAKARAALAASRAAATETQPGDLIRRQNVLEICESHGASGEAIGDEVAALPTVQPQPVAVQQAAQVPEVKALIEAALPYVSPVQNADFSRQVKQHEALCASLSAIGGEA